jgi:AcrR family transcriptional regulator
VTPRRSTAGLRRRYPTLPPGPGRSREKVASHQRARIHAAMIELVAECGYGAVTVSEVVRRARVSSRSFYEHFGDKDECFLATYDAIALRSARRVAAAHEGERDWSRRLVLALGAWTSGIAREPKMARLALVEAFEGGPAGLERMRRAEEMFEAMIAQSFARAPDPVVVPPLIVKGIVTGVHRVARARLLAGGADELPGLAEEALEWMLCFRCPAAAAVVELQDRSTPALSVARIGVAGDHGGVRADDRTHILDAVASLAAQDGYWQLTVPRIRTAAGVSRKRFDEHFADVQDCFIAALERHTDRVLARVVTPAGAAGATWGGGLHRALHALCAHLAANPAVARLGFIEVLSPGTGGMRCRERAIAEAAGVFRASAPPGQRPSELAAEASVGAVWGVVHRLVAVGFARRLPQIVPTLSFLALAPAIGAQRAVEAITAEQARMFGLAGSADALARASA